jgi:hypothetical protein
MFMPMIATRLLSGMVLLALVGAVACGSGSPIDVPVAGTETMTLAVRGMT